MQAPEIDVTLSTGQTVPLKSLYENERLALVFLRHLGCVFCKEHVGELRTLKDSNIVFVTLGSAEQTEAFRQKMKSPHRFISDPEKKLHALFNLQRGGMAQLINPHVVVRMLSGLLKGYMQGLPQGDTAQLPGVFLVDRDGKVSWEHRGANMADIVAPKEIQRRLGPVEEKP